MTWDGHCGDQDWGKVVYAHWAQKLERERDEARAMALDMRNQFEKESPFRLIFPWENDQSPATAGDAELR